VGWAPDLRGHGQSPTPDSHRFAWAGFADDVLAVVDVLQLHQPVGVGHSKGGAALLLAEARRPGTFSALWLYEPVVFPPTLASSGGAPPAELSGRARNRRARFASFAEAEANFASKPPLDVLDPAALHAYVQHGFAEQPDGSVTLRCRPEDEAKVYEMGSQHDAWEHLDEVRCPVTIVRGALDAPGPVLMAAPVAERLPAGHLEAHDDLGHFGPLQDPARMAASVLAAMATR
jgi:pimeloyl-ACP methyl ester carboxylesterase